MAKKTQFTVKIDEQTAKNFKKKILTRYGTTYGTISLCVEEAFNDWIKKQNEGEKK